MKKQNNEMLERECIDAFVKMAKADSKKFKTKWIYLYSDIILWNVVNLIDKDPLFLKQLKERYILK